MGEKEDFFDILKKDILYLDQEIKSLKLELSYLNNLVKETMLFIKSNLRQNKEFTTEKEHNQINKELFKSLKDQNLYVSIGNRGVPTDKQTHTQIGKKPNFETNLDLDSAVYILESLDSLKKEIRLKFKKLTNQEMAVFSLIYLTEQDLGYANYKIIANKLNLTESSIRDYVRRLILKGIPLEKEKLNNKEVIIRISRNLRKITTLETIQKLRDI